MRGRLLSVGLASALSLGGCASLDEDMGSTELAAQLPPSAKLPDLQTVVPQQLQLQGTQQGDWLRFSNGVANTGAGPLQFRQGAIDPVNQTQEAIQQILDTADPGGAVVGEELVSVYAFHPAHHHWHINDVAGYAIHAGSPTGTIVREAPKVTSCLIDWYPMFKNGFGGDQFYWECNAALQGIQRFWVDQYHQSLEGQEININGLAAGPYCLVSTSNPLGTFVESDYTNNSAWQCFNLTYTNGGNGGNPKITMTTHSACDPGLCGESVPNH